MKPKFLLALFFFAQSAIAFAEIAVFDIGQVDPKAGTLSATTNNQVRTVQVPGTAVVTVNGLKATLAEVEPGMKAQIQFGGGTASASRVDASGLRKVQPPGGIAKIAWRAQTARDFQAHVPAASADGYVIGDVQRGSKITIKYLSGRWKANGAQPDQNPDGEATQEKDRLVLALPTADKAPGAALATVPGNTAKHPFTFEADKDFPGMTLRIHGADNKFFGPGAVDYLVKIVPPR